MEPQNNYSMGPGGDPYQKPKIYKNSAGSGCMKTGLIIGGIAIVVLIGGMIYFTFFAINKFNEVTQNIPNLNNFTRNTEKIDGDKRFNGEFLDAVFVPQEGGSPRIFILTDASKKYVLKKKSTGSYSVGTECTDCKTIGILYDPLEDKIIKNTENKFDGVITESNILYQNGKIIQFTRGSDDNPPRINTYDASSGELLSDTKAFIDRFPELSGGIAQVSFRDDFGTVEIDTKDGKKDVVYCMANDKMYRTRSEMDDDLAKNAGNESQTFCVLRTMKNDARKVIWKISASQKDMITNKSTYLSYVGEPSEEFRMIGAKSELLSDKGYLEGIIYFQDSDYVVVIYLDQVGKVANRIMTCIDTKNGKEIWTINQDGLFKYMKVDEKNDSFSRFDLSKDMIRIKRFGKILLLQYHDDGVMGIDCDSGKRLWMVETQP